MPDFDPSPAPAGSALVLVVDDEPKNIQVVGPLLYQRGYEIIAAGSGEEALVKLRTAQPDLILLDVMMPGMTGFDLCRRLQAHPDWKEVPVIFLSAVTDKSFVTEALEAGAVDYLTKPFHAQELLSRVQLQLNLRETRKRLAAALEERNHLLEAVAHDLKNPLGSVQLAAALLAENAGGFTPTQLALVENISGSASRALEITASLLQTRRLEEAKATLGLASLCLNEYTRQAVSALAQHAATKRIEILVSCEDEAIKVRADRRSLLCALENLLSNAVKFSPPGSTVRIQLERDRSHGAFRIRDQGPGVRDDERPLLFRKFSRLSARPTGGELSTGLGLHIVHELAKAMGGEVFLEHTDPTGACFVIRLPLAR